MQGVLIRRHTELDVYKRAFSAAMRIFELVKGGFRGKSVIRLFCC